MMRRAPMKRTAWNRRPKVDQPAQTEGEHAQAAAVLRAPVAPLHRGVIAPANDTFRPAPKAPAPVRDEEYRRLVAQLPCFHCRIEGASQCAHPNTGKAKGRKTCDLLTFPLCHAGAKDCHARFDQYRLVDKADMPDFERRAHRWTVRDLLARGMWPARLALPDLRTFN